MLDSGTQCEDLLLAFSGAAAEERNFALVNSDVVISIHKLTTTIQQQVTLKNSLLPQSHLNLLLPRAHIDSTAEADIFRAGESVHATFVTVECFNVTGENQKNLLKALSQIWSELVTLIVREEGFFTQNESAATIYILIH